MVICARGWGLVRLGLALVMWLARDFTDGVYQHLDSFLRQNERAVVVEDFSSGFVLVDRQGTAKTEVKMRSVYFIALSFYSAFWRVSVKKYKKCRKM